MFNIYNINLNKEQIINSSWDRIFYHCNDIIINSIINFKTGYLKIYPKDVSECSTCNLQAICKKYENVKNVNNNLLGIY